MNCLQNLPRSVAVPLRGNLEDSRKPPVVELGIFRAQPRKRIVMAMNAKSGPTSSAEKSTTESNEEKSEIYSHNMTEAMGAVLTYRHELGMNYNFILPDLIVGSCLQAPEDVDKLRSIGVKTIFCLQQDSDLAYFSVDIGAIREYANECDDIEHYRAEIRDFDAFDLRQRLPAVVSKLHKAVNRNGGITYIHCTAGLGRAPAVAKLILPIFVEFQLAYMFWVLGYPLGEAHKLLLSKRPCFPKLDAIKGATADILTGSSKGLIKLTWDGNDCSSVEVSGLDIGWGQRIPLKFDEDKRSWFLERELPEGKYEYKYIIDGEWTCNEYESVTKPNDDGHVNNYVHVHDVDSKLETKQLRDHLMGDDVDLSEEQRRVIQEYLDTCIED